MSLSSKEYIQKLLQIRNSFKYSSMKDILSLVIAFDLTDDYILAAVPHLTITRITIMLVPQPLQNDDSYGGYNISVTPDKMENMPDFDARYLFAYFKKFGFYLDDVRFHYDPNRHNKKLKSVFNRIRNDFLNKYCRRNVTIKYCIRSPTEMAAVLLKVVKIQELFKYSSLREIMAFHAALSDVISGEDEDQFIKLHASKYDLEHFKTVTISVLYLWDCFYGRDVIAGDLYFRNVEEFEIEMFFRYFGNKIDTLKLYTGYKTFCEENFVTLSLYLYFIRKYCTNLRAHVIGPIDEYFDVSRFKSCAFFNRLELKILSLSDLGQERQITEICMLNSVDEHAILDVNLKDSSDVLTVASFEKILKLPCLKRLIMLSSYKSLDGWTSTKLYGDRKILSQLSQLEFTNREGDSEQYPVDDLLREMLNLTAASQLKLDYLTLKQCSITYRHLIPSNTLRLINTSVTFDDNTTSKVIESLELIRINDLQEIKANASKFSNIHLVKFDQCPSLTDDILFDVIRSIPVLRNVEIKNCPLITDGFFHKILAQKMTEIEIQKCLFHCVALPRFCLENLPLVSADLLKLFHRNKNWKIELDAVNNVNVIVPK